jgi:hypothetical protein
VGVQGGDYGQNSRVVLQGVTVTGVTGPIVSVMGGPSCLADPADTEPMYCGQIVPSMDVDFTAARSLPEPGTAIDLYGATDGALLTPAGFVTVAWCDPDWCP